VAKDVAHELQRSRQERLRSVMHAQCVPAVLTADPINIVYGCGVRNMTIFGMMGPSRFLLLFADGPSILYEFAGSEHLAEGVQTVDEVRTAPSITAHAGPHAPKAATAFASELFDECRHHVGSELVLAVERVDFGLTDELRRHGLRLADATGVFAEARRIKQRPELDVMREAVRRVERGVACVEVAARPGATEIEVWAELHRSLIASDGEYVSTRLLQSGPNTFPYFKEAGGRRLAEGDLLCIDTDAIGFGGYAVDFSRTMLVGDGDPTSAQRTLFGRALEQLSHNAALLAPGRSYEELARRAWPVPAQHRPFGYYCSFHGLGMSGEHPYVPTRDDGGPFPLPGALEPDMVICVESYLGDEATQQGVKLEDQYLITRDGADRLTRYPFDERLAAEG